MSGKFYRLKNPSSWRRISIANWNAPNDPTVYGTYPIEFKTGQDFLEKINRNSTEKITVTHLVAKAIALTLSRYPDLNGIIKWKSIYLRKTVDIFLQVAIPPEGDSQRPDLSGAKVENCDQKSLFEIAEDLKQKSQKIRQKKDPQFKKVISLLKWIPTFMLSWIVKIISFLVYNLNIRIPSFGLPEDPFGSAMVTSVGMLKVPSGFAPLVPLSRCPLIVCVGQVQLKPWVIEGKVEARPVLDLSFTFDHRFMDGLVGSKMAQYFKGIIENPEKYLS